MKKISNRIIRKLNPCYDPSEIVKDENEELPVKEWVVKYRNLVRDKSDIIWLLCNKLYMSERNIRLFAVWCAREALKLIDNPDPRSIAACNVAERFANGKATIDELTTAWAAALSAANDADSASRAADAAAYWTADAYAAAADAARATADAARYAAAAAYYAADIVAAAYVAAAARYATAAAAAAAFWTTADVAVTAQIDKLMTYFD